MLNLPQNTKAIHYYDENISFPVFIYTRNDWEEVQVSYLNQNYDSAKFTTLSLCQWCESHQIKYQILFPRNKFKLMIKDFKRFYVFYILKKKDFKKSIARSLILSWKIHLAKTEHLFHTDFTGGIDNGFSEREDRRYLSAYKRPKDYTFEN